MHPGSSPSPQGAYFVDPKHESLWNDAPRELCRHPSYYIRPVGSEECRQRSSLTEVPAAPSTGRRHAASAEAIMFSEAHLPYAACTALLRAESLGARKHASCPLLRAYTMYPTLTCLREVYLRHTHTHTHRGGIGAALGPHIETQGRHRGRIGAA